MSVRAYKVVVPAKLADSPSFNLWHDDEVIEFLNDAGADIWSRASGDSGGTIELERSIVKAALEAAKEARDNTTEKEVMDRFEEAVATLEGILKDFKKGEDYVVYECY